MAEAISMDKIYGELKAIEKKMVTKEELERILETVEIMANVDTIEQIRESEGDIAAGRAKVVKSARDI